MTTLTKTPLHDPMIADTPRNTPMPDAPRNPCRLTEKAWSRIIASIMIVGALCLSGVGQLYVHLQQKEKLRNISLDSKFIALLRESNGGIIEVAGNSRTILDIDSNVTALLGFDAEELKGLFLSDVFSPTIAQLDFTKTPINIVHGTWMKSKSGVYMPVLVWGVHHVASNRLMLGVVSFDKITITEDQLEDRLRQSAIYYSNKDFVAQGS